MTNKKISALTSATVPLAGTEVLPIVQSGATVNVSVNNLTAGKAVPVQSLQVGLTSTNWGANEVILLGKNGASNPTYPAINSTNSQDANFVNNAYWDGTNWKYQFALVSLPAVKQTVSYNEWAVYGAGNGAAGTNISWTKQLAIDPTTGNVTFNVGNVIQGTAAKGVNFTANTPASGMTSQLLNWYEEGTWTPNQGAGLTLVGAFSSTGKYTRVGRNVTVSGTVTGATSVSVTAAGVITTNLPFTIGTAGHGNATNAANTAFVAIVCNTGTTVTSAGAIAATGTITFSATYFV